VQAGLRRHLILDHVGSSVFRSFGLSQEHQPESEKKHDTRGTSINHINSPGEENAHHRLEEVKKTPASVVRKPLVVLYHPGHAFKYPLLSTDPSFIQLKNQSHDVKRDQVEARDMTNHPSGRVEKPHDSTPDAEGEAE